MKLNREDLLRQLEAVVPGLATKEVLEQSSCFVFQDNTVTTFNDDVCCRMVCPMGGLSGATPARPLLELLGRLNEQYIDISEDKGGIIVKGKRRRASIQMEAEVMLPISNVAMPTKWVKLDPNFTDAVGVVQHCASKDTNNFHLTCIHITPDHVEACDNFQLARYPVATGFTTEALVKRDSLKHVTGLGMTEVSVGDTWCHFRNPAGLVLSVRRESGDYDDLTPILDTRGEGVTLPGGLAEAVDRAEVFSGENSENNVVFIQLKNSEIRIKGEGASGWFEERKQVAYDGKPMGFAIAPKLLIDITEQTNECEISEGLLRVANGKYVYATCLGAIGD